MHKDNIQITDINDPQATKQSVNTIKSCQI